MNSPKFKSTMDIENLETSPELQAVLARDYAAATEDLGDGFSRRRWLQLMGASLALGGMAGCRYQEEKIVPFAFRPQNRVPGIPQKFASMIDFAGVAQPLIATCYDGRPVKLDGNPDHPLSQGRSTAFTQARILDLYDPERMRAPFHLKGKTQIQADWQSLNDFATSRLAPQDLSNVAILTEEVGSPSLLRLLAQLTDRGARWFHYSAVNLDNTREGARLAYGKPYRLHYHLDRADVVVTLDADPLMMDPNGLGNSIGFARRRDPDRGAMSRLYAVESQFSHTGAAADHRISVRSQDMAGFVGALAEAIDRAGDTIDPGLSYRDKTLACMAQDLAQHKGRSLIICGESQPPEVHAAVHALNAILNNLGSTITMSEPADIDRPNCLKSIQEFKAQAGEIETLIVLDGNPVYTAPRELGLDKLIDGIQHTLYVGQYRNETARRCQWVAAAAHPLESWLDGIAYDGSICIGQPLIDPLFGSPSVLEMLATWMGQSVTEGMAIVRETLGLDEKRWRHAVHDGFVAESQADSIVPDLNGGIQIPPADAGWKSDWDGGSLELVFCPSRSVYDGRFANSSWLQELPDFVTKLTWDNALLVSPRTYEVLKSRHGIRSQMIANVKANGEVVGLPVLVQPGMADGSLGIQIGYGRTAAGRVGGDLEAGVPPVGFDVNHLRTIKDWHVTEVDPPTGTSTAYKLALVQEPWDIDPVGRNEIQARMFRDRSKAEGDRSELLREGTYESYQAFLKDHPIDHSDPDHEHGDGHASNGSSKHGATIGELAGALPVIQPVSYVRPMDEVAADGEAEGGHAHHAQWPEAFHLHHENFDITPGAREDYKFDPNDPTQTNRWGMSIDLTRCIGCNACVIACQAENNVPVVGKADVIRGREMHWIRIDRYFGENLYNDQAAKEDDKQIIHQPVACHHCENAPCETVCPVAATTHSREGLNDMIYNRCIGTRYCGNNCPYKVRRFNYFNYSDAVTFLKYPGADKLSEADRSIQNLMMNPEVTVRSRGVMEKCTFCVQRIQNAKIQAKVDGHPNEVGEITTACQDACPTRAIEFGDLCRRSGRVRQAHDNPRAYAMLEGLNVIPRTKYLSRVRNVHPALIDYDDRDSVRGGRKAGKTESAETH